MACGLLFYGPLSDSTGRKPAIYVGLVLFLSGCLLSVFATSFSVMLAGRFLQGLGAAGPRIVVIALVRDQHAGRAMARIMSFVMAVFILVPALAPALGQAILAVAHWRAIFASLLVLAVIAFAWFAIRQPETLPRERRCPLRLRGIAEGVVETCANRQALGYTLAMGLIFGAFIGYLSSAQQVFQGHYGVGVLFPAYFAALALSIGSASVVNARLVMRFGMRNLSSRALWMLSSLSVVFLAVTAAAAGHPPLWAFMAFFMPVFFCIGILFGNFNALAMEPLGHIAGVAATVVGSLSTFISLLLGTVIGQGYDGTVLPLVVGFAVLGLAALVVLRWTERKT
jgi:DHA1 family bicyclomycin/chloramphenicol resistance-like MFS transporter